MNRSEIIDKLVAARVAVIAARIWDEGYEAGETDGYATGRGYWESNESTNPYRKAE